MVEFITGFEVYIGSGGHNKFLYTYHLVLNQVKYLGTR